MSRQRLRPLDRGTCVTVRTDVTTTPRKLGMIASSADDWGLLLRSQTALGRLSRDGSFPFDLKAYVQIARDGAGIEWQECGTEFLYPHLVGTRDGESPLRKYVDLGEYYRVHTDRRFTVPGTYKNKDGMYKLWAGDELVELIGAADWKGPDEEDAGTFVANTNAWFYGFMAYGTDYYKAHHLVTGGRGPIVTAGIVLGTEGMTVGDYAEVSLKRYTGRQYQTTCILHIDGLRPDLGRKTLPAAIEKLSQLVGRKCIEWFAKDGQNDQFLRPPRRRVSPAVGLEAWSDGAKAWARDHPLRWGSLKLALVSEPQQEQDVVILFSQLVDAGQLPGYQIFSAAESNRQYDALMKLHLPVEGQEPYSEEHPQGLTREFLEGRKPRSRPPSWSWSSSTNWATSCPTSTRRRSFSRISPSPSPGRRTTSATGPSETTS